MIPYALDPSLHATEPEPALLDDGFSAPRITARSPSTSFNAGTPASSLEEALASKSEF